MTSTSESESKNVEAGVLLGCPIFERALSSVSSSDERPSGSSTETTYARQSTVLASTSISTTVCILDVDIHILCHALGSSYIQKQYGEPHAVIVRHLLIFTSSVEDRVFQREISTIMLVRKNRKKKFIVLFQDLLFYCTRVNRNASRGSVYSDWYEKERI